MKSIEEIKEQICDNYCKYPCMLNCYLEDICNECPLNELKEED